MKAVSVLLALAFLAGHLSLAQWKPTAIIPGGLVQGGAVQALAASRTRLYAVSEGSVFFSADSAATWKSISAGLQGQAISTVALSGRTIFVGTAPSTFEYSRVFRSTDNGASWTAADSGLVNLELYSLAASDSAVFITALGGLFRSTDQGRTWVNKDTTANLARQPRYLAVSGRHVYSGDNWGNLFRSEDDGNQWVDARRSFDPEIFTSALTAYDSLVYAGLTYFTSDHYSGTVFRSTDYGLTWTPLPPILRLNYGSSLQIVGTRVLAGCDSGLYVSTDSARSWSRVDTGLTSTKITALAAMGSCAFAGTASGGVFRSTDGGMQWSAANNGLLMSTITAFAADDSTLMAGGSGGLMYRSTDVGMSWQNIASGLFRNTVSCLLPWNGAWLTAGPMFSLHRLSRGDTSWSVFNPSFIKGRILSLAGSGPALYAAIADEGVWHSTDMGQTWLAPLNGETVFDAYCLLASGSTIFAGTRGRGIFRSTDGGVHWTPSDSAFGQSWVNAVIQLNGAFFAGTSGGHLFRSSSNGESWNEVTSPASCDIQTLSASGAALVAGTSCGVYASSNGGGSWTPLNEGLVDRNIAFLAIMSPCIIAQTATAGPWRRLLSEIIAGLSSREQMMPGAFQLYPNYPNPFNPSTMIRFSLLNRSHVELTVFNVLGQQVAELINGEIDAGGHETQFNASNLATGMYFYRLRTGALIQTRSLVVLR